MGFMALASPCPYPAGLSCVIWRGTVSPANPLQLADGSLPLAAWVGDVGLPTLCLPGRDACPTEGRGLLGGCSASPETGLCLLGSPVAWLFPLGLPGADPVLLRVSSHLQ